MHDVWRDVQYGIRLLAKRRGFTVIAVLTLALGIGANTAIFSVVNAVLLEPLPYAEPEQLVRIYGNMTAVGMNKMSASVPEFTDYRQRTSSFQNIAGYDDFSANITPVGGEPERVEGLAVTPELFSALRVEPQLGRVFLPEEAQDGRDDVILISDGFWRRGFAADPNIVGKSVLVNGRNHTIVGVMPRGFDFPLHTQIWKPLWFPAEQYTSQWRGSRGLSVIGRLKADTRLSEAQVELDSLAVQLIADYPRNYESRGWKIGLVRLLDDYVGESRRGLMVLLGAVGFVLLIACANVANLSLTRASGRRQEIAIRSALGAGRWRLTRQLLTESVVLAFAGGLLGLLLAWWSTDLLLRLAPANLPRTNDVRLDARVLVFTMLVSLVTGILFGLVPALAASRVDLNESLKESGRSSTTSAGLTRMRSAFAVAQITMALVLLIGAGLMLKSLWRLQGVDPGFNPDGVLTMRMMLPFEIYQKPSQRGAFYERLLEGTAAVPGVESVSATSSIPLTRSAAASGTISGENSAVGPNDLPVECEWRWITPEYFKSIGVTVTGGRTFAETDGEGAPLVAIVDESFARRFYPDEDPVGKRIKRGKLDSTRPWMTIVGLVHHVQSRRYDETSGPQVYFPFFQDPTAYNMSLVVRTSMPDPLSLSGTMRSVVQSLDPNQPVFDVSTLRQIVGHSMAERRFGMLLMVAFAVLAVALATVGIYGVMSFAVAQRTHELGIRIALGAGSVDVLRLVLGEGLRISLTGVLIGLGAAVAMTRLIASLLYEVSTSDPATFVAVALLFTVVALLACYIPARRAANVDPIVALRCE